MTWKGCVTWLCFAVGFGWILSCGAAFTGTHLRDADLARQKIEQGRNAPESGGEVSLEVLIGEEGRERTPMSAVDGLMAWICMGVTPGGFALLIGLLFGRMARKERAAAKDHELRERFVGVVTAHGEIAIADAARELGVSSDAVKSLMYELVASGRIAGRIDAEAGRLICDEAASGPEAVTRKCPACGAKTKVWGESSRCEFCGGEVSL